MNPPKVTDEDYINFIIATPRDVTATEAERVLMGMFSLVALIADELSKTGRLKVRQTVWYQKQMATFSDAIGCVRQQIWEWQSLQTSNADDEMIKIPRQYLECLTDTLCFVS